MRPCSLPYLLTPLVHFPNFKAVTKPSQYTLTSTFIQTTVTPRCKISGNGLLLVIVKGSHSSDTYKGNIYFRERAAIGDPWGVQVEIPRQDNSAYSHIYINDVDFSGDNLVFSYNNSIYTGTDAMCHYLMTRSGANYTITSHFFSPEITGYRAVAAAVVSDDSLTCVERKIINPRGSYVWRRPTSSDVFTRDSLFITDPLGGVGFVTRSLVGNKMLVTYTDLGVVEFTLGEDSVLYDPKYLPSETLEDLLYVYQLYQTPVYDFPKIGVAKTPTDSFPVSPLNNTSQLHHRTASNDGKTLVIINDNGVWAGQWENMTVYTFDLI